MSNRGKMRPGREHAALVQRGELPKDRLWYTIGDVCRWLAIRPSAIWYWETQFGSRIKAQRMSSGKRWYTRDGALMLGVIRELLYTELYTIEGAKRQLRLAAERERQVG